MDFVAVRPLSVEESEKVRCTIDPKRILPSRFAYKDKNYAKRKVVNWQPVEQIWRIAKSKAGSRRFAEWILLLTAYLPSPKLVFASQVIAIPTWALWTCRWTRRPPADI